MPRHLPISCTLLLLALSGCASTTTSLLTPSPQDPVCRSSTTALVLWATQWRPDQKDVLAREAAAAEGLREFFDKSGCFNSARLQRLPPDSAETIQTEATGATASYEKVVVIAVRELGPIVKIGASLALVEGGTEVVLYVSEYEATKPAPRTFTVQWRNGGPGVLKGVATLPKDMQAALAAGLQPPTR